MLYTFKDFGFDFKVYKTFERFFFHRHCQESVVLFEEQNIIKSKYTCFTIIIESNDGSLFNCVKLENSHSWRSYFIKLLMQRQQ